MTTEPGNEARNADLVARLSALGAAAASGEKLAGAAAEAIVAATRAVEVAIFAADAPPLMSTRRARLIRLGEARGAGIAVDAARQRRMRRAAHAAIGDEAPRLARSNPNQPDAAESWFCIAQRIALPEGAAVVACGLAEDASALRAALEGAGGALALLLRLARAEREVASTRDLVAQSRAIFSHSSDAILIVDGDYHVLAANAAFAQMLDLTDTPVDGRGCHEVLTCQDERGQALCDTPGCPLTQAFADPPFAPYRDLLWRTGNGARRLVSASFIGVPVNGGWQAVTVARDNTPLKAANRMRSNFISMVSHELRTPLNSLNGFLEIVLEGQAGPLRPRQEEFLNYARTSTHALMRLVEDIVFISRADTGQFTLRREAADVSELVAPVLRAHQLAAQRAGIDLRVDIVSDLPLACVDESRIQQVLHNLVMNAIKFTPAPGAVVISATRELGALRLAVRDTGTGVVPEDQVRIFERFYQSESIAKGNAAGYGLGLAIAKLIVEQHGGRIWVESPPGTGATFAFTVPFIRDGVPCPPSEGSVAEPSHDV
jgi:two-component system phosphate regulon sensor histidine kinase PhoR